MIYTTFDAILTSPLTQKQPPVADNTKLQDEGCCEPVFSFCVVIETLLNGHPTSTTCECFVWSHEVIQQLEDIQVGSPVKVVGSMSPNRLFRDTNGVKTKLECTVFRVAAYKEQSPMGDWFKMKASIST